MKRKYKLLFTFIFGSAIAYVTTLYFAQEKLIFKRRITSREYDFSIDGDFKEHFFSSDDGGEINALHFQVNAPKGVVLYFHGSGSNLETYWTEVAKDFTSRGYDILISDYRGYGKSRGKLSEKALLEDAKVQYQYLLEKYPQEQIIIYGRSLGTAIATHVASLYQPSQLILESPFFSMYHLVCDRYRYLPSSLITAILKYPFRTDQWIQNVSCPIHIFHGTEDKVVPYANSLKLTSSAPDSSKVQLTTIDDGRHDNVIHHPLYHLTLDQLL